VFAALALLGLLLVASAGVIAVADIGALSTRMPTQLPPRRFARYPLIAGIALVVIGVAGLLMP
jgi:hypothetical protein